MLRACKAGDAPDQGEWNMDESEYGTLIYSLKQEGWRKGEPIMVNDVTIRIENANGSSHDLGPIAARILAALEPAPDARQEGWRAGVEAAKSIARLVGEDSFAPMTRTRDEAFSAACGEVERQINELKKGQTND